MIIDFYKIFMNIYIIADATNDLICLTSKNIN